MNMHTNLISSFDQPRKCGVSVRAWFGRERSVAAAYVSDKVSVSRPLVV